MVSESAKKTLEQIVSADPSAAEIALLKAALAGNEVGIKVLESAWADPARAPETDVCLLNRDLTGAFRAIWLAQDILRGTNADAKNTANVAVSFLSGLEGAGYLTAEQAENAKEFLIKISCVTESDLVMASAVYPAWLKLVVAEKLKFEIAGAKWTGADVVESAKNALKSLETSENSNLLAGHYALGHGTDNAPEDDSSERIPVFPVTLNKCLNGGLKRGEATMFIGPNGSGKTIIALQVATSLVESGLTGLFISTEQPHYELEPRIWSCGASIPFSKIEAGLKTGWKKLSAKEKEAYERYRKTLTAKGGQLHWLDWRENRSRAVTSSIAPIAEEMRKKIGKLDFIVLDWLGAALGDNAMKDKDGGLRMRIQEAADSMADLATDKNLITIVTAQATANAVNKKRVSRTDLAECKTAGNKMTNVIGISAMYAQEQKVSQDSEIVYDIEQWFNVDKSRKGVASCLRVYRQFQFQRFVHERPGV